MGAVPNFKLQYHSVPYMYPLTLPNIFLAVCSPVILMIAINVLILLAGIIKVIYYCYLAKKGEGRREKKTALDAGIAITLQEKSKIKCPNCSAPIKKEVNDG